MHRFQEIYNQTGSSSAMATRPSGHQSGAARGLPPPHNRQRGVVAAGTATAGRRRPVRGFGRPIRRRLRGLSVGPRLLDHRAITVAHRLAGGQSSQAEEPPP